MQFRSQGGPQVTSAPTDSDRPTRLNEEASSLSLKSKIDLEEGSEPNGKPRDVTVADIVGQFGLYQLSLTLITFIRYINLAMMTNTGPLLAPELDFWCDLPNSTKELVDKPQDITMDEYLKKKCLVKLIDGSQINCDRWTYNASSTGTTLTNTFDLVCERDYLRSSFQSSVSAGIVVASVIWGSISDRHGRYLTVNACFICSLISGLASYLADSLLMYSVSRSICSFGDLGLVVSLTTLLIETLGNKYRGAICIVVYTGWSFGVMVMPWITDYFRDFRQLMLLTVALHVLSLPWILTVGESARWMMINGKLDESLVELKRICRWNKSLTRTKEESVETFETEIERKFALMRPKYAAISERRLKERQEEDERCGTKGAPVNTVFGGLSKVNLLFDKRDLSFATITIVWTNFTSELFYMLFIIINTDIGDNVKLNYAIGGAMETLATILSIIMISVLSRRFSLISTLISISSLCLTLAFTNHLKSISVWVLNIAKLAESTLSSLIYVTTTESFPTSLRQTGFGLAGTIGSIGAVVAPFIRTELTDIIGMTNVMLLLSILPLTAAGLIPFFLKETKGVEIADDIDE